MIRMMFAPTTGKMYLPTSERLETNKSHRPSQQHVTTCKHTTQNDVKKGPNVSSSAYVNIGCKSSRTQDVETYCEYQLISAQMQAKDQELLGWLSEC